MPNPQPAVLCMSATPFRSDGALDEPAFVAHLGRLVEAGVGVYLGSGGAGEGHALSRDELRRVYELGVATCRGKAPVFANPPEQRTPQNMLDVARLAADAGVDVIQLYGVDAGHGMRPTATEQEAYYRHILDRLDYKIALTIHPAVGYLPGIPLLRRLCADYGQIVAINVMTGLPHSFMRVRDAVGHGVALYTRMIDMAPSVPLGAAGVIAAEPNLVPRFSRAMLDSLAAGDVEAFGADFARFVRLSGTLEKWAPSTARWAKMGLKVLGLPGGNGAMRLPYMLPPEEELRELATALGGLGIPELKAAAGWTG
jgi:4-hydroxy-tetrahydrodipicolinate synthase